MKPRLLPATRTSASGKSSDARYGRRRTRVIHRATARRRSRAGGGARGTRDPPAEARLDGTPSPSANGRSSGTPCPISSPTSTRRRSRRGAARGSTTTYRPPRRRREKHAVVHLMTRRRIGIGRTSGAAACWRAWNGATRSASSRARREAVRARVKAETEKTETRDGDVPMRSASASKSARSSRDARDDRDFEMIETFSRTVPLLLVQNSRAAKLEAPHDPAAAETSEGAELGAEGSGSSRRCSSA